MNSQHRVAFGLLLLTTLAACGGGNSAKPDATPNATLTVTAAVPGTDVLTYKNDLNRSGQNPTESTLTLTNVTSATFGLLRTLAVDGKVDAQPL